MAHSWCKISQLGLGIWGFPRCPWVPRKRRKCSWQASNTCLIGNIAFENAITFEKKKKKKNQHKTLESDVLFTIWLFCKAKLRLPMMHSNLISACQELAHSALLVSYGVIEFGQHCSGNGLVPNGTKPLPEQLLTCHYEDPLAFTCETFNKKSWIY